MIVIVGAGIACLSVAYELVRRGARVTVVEANQIAVGASGVATSYLKSRLGNTAMRAIERDSIMVAVWNEWLAPDDIEDPEPVCLSSSPEAARLSCDPV